MFYFKKNTAPCCVFPHLHTKYLEVECPGDGTLWIGHWGNGLDRFDYETETFRHYNLNLAGGTNNNGANMVSALVEDRDGQLWIGTGNGLMRLNPNTGKLKHFQHDPQPRQQPQLRLLPYPAGGCCRHLVDRHRVPLGQ